MAPPPPQAATLFAVQSESSRDPADKVVRAIRLNPLLGVKITKRFTPPGVAPVLGISYPTLKHWIHKGKSRTTKTAGGHDRVPEEEVDKFLYRDSRRRGVRERRTNFRRISGRNQLVGRVTEIQISGLVAQFSLSIGGQHIMSIVTSDAVREMRLKFGETAAALVKSPEVMIVRP